MQSVAILVAIEISVPVDASISILVAIGSPVPVENLVAVGLLGAVECFRPRSVLAALLSDRTGRNQSR